MEVLGEEGAEEAEEGGKGVVADDEEVAAGVGVGRVPDSAPSPRISCLLVRSGGGATSLRSMSGRKDWVTRCNGQL